MRMLAAALGAATAIALLSGCVAYSGRSAYGYGNGYYSDGYYSDRYYGDRYSSNYDRYVGDCWYDREGDRHCVRR